MFHLQCKQCGKWEVVSDARDPDSQLTCGCCPQDHHHGQAANETGQPCRALTITVLPGTAKVG